VKSGASVGLVISDGSLISILAAMAGFKKVVSIFSSEEENRNRNRSKNCKCKIS
jgi:hypothetical protein